MSGEGKREDEGESRSEFLRLVRGEEAEDEGSIKEVEGGERGDAPKVYKNEGGGWKEGRMGRRRRFGLK